MNYYIQGSPARAKEIKAAFEKLGYNSRGLDFSCGFFYTVERDVHYCVSDYCIVHIIKTHPDYKELELPVEPKFKDGDVLVTTKIRSCPFIYRKPDFNNDLAYYYVGIDGNGDLSIGWPKRTLCHFGLIADAVIAGQGQRDFLFQKIKQAGYEWDAEKKELRKIKPHYDISNFKPFDKVLVRDFNGDKWRCGWFSDYDEKSPFSFITTGANYKQCIPFEGNEHLLGTTDPCDEQYINW